MKKKVIIIVTVILIIFLLIGVGIFKIVDSIRQDSKNAQKQIEEVATYYEEFNKNALAFNEKKKAYDDLMDKMFYTTISKNNESLLKILNEYDEIIGKIKENGNILEDKCSVYYRDNETMQKCSSYKITYESAMTVFINDVKRYNNLVINYNEWTKENTTYKPIKEYVSKNVE